MASVHRTPTGSGGGTTVSLLDAAWSPITPPVPAAVLDQIAATDGDRERVATIARNLFDAANSGIEASEALERAHRELAAHDHARLSRINKTLASEPETQTLTIKETIGKPCGWNAFSGGLGLGALGALLTPIPVVVSMGIAQSLVFDAVSDDWRLGIPFGVPALGAILASGLLRQTLSHGARDVYDRIISGAGLVALAGWTGGYAYTFLAPVDLSGGPDAALGGDLRLFYAAHLGLEITAGLGLAAMAERSFTAGRKVISVVNGALEHLARIGASVADGWLGRLHQAETFKARRERLAAAKAAYVETCLAYLDHARARRSAAMAQAAASFGDPSPKD